MDSFYENIGGKLKSWAKVIFLFGAISSVIAGLAMFGEEAVVPGLITLILGPIFSLISTWLLYAFGELVEKTAANEENTRRILELMNNKHTPKSVIPDLPKPPQPAKHSWRCSSCGKMTSTAPCEHCGHAEQTAPFRCGSCGHRGPYTGPCPSCGSSIRIFH